MPAKVKVLIEGCVSADGDMGETRPTVSLVQDGSMIMVVDPGVLGDQQLLVDALQKEGLSVEQVNMVALTHSHIDHYKNVGMFQKAKVLEYFGVWEGGRVEDWQEEFTGNIQILKTPGHDYSSITLFIKTDDGVVAICGDVFWKENYPEIDSYASDLKKLEHSRELVQKMSHWIIPGHAGMYKTENGHRLQKIKSGKKAEVRVLGNCKKCHKAFKNLSDKCVCQEWLCYKCCECEYDCLVCNCSHKR